MKYIVKDHLNIYLFGRNIGHDEFSSQINGRCTSAGFVNLTTMQCYGESDSLGVSSCSTDTGLLRALSPNTRPLTTELKVIRAEIAAALQSLASPPLQLQAADRRLAGLVAGTMEYAGAVRP